MQIIKQISEDTFEVRMDKCDIQPTNSLVIAHDYIMFCGTGHISTDPKVMKGPLHGKYAWCSNVIHYANQIQIPIRRFAKAYKTIFMHHEYLEDKHLLNSNGNPKYCEGDKFFYKDSVYIRPEGSSNYIVYSKDEYRNLVELIKQAEHLVPEEEKQ